MGSEIEARANALHYEVECGRLDVYGAILAAIQQGRNGVLEDAAKVADFEADQWGSVSPAMACQIIARKLRALKSSSEG